MKMTRKEALRYRQIIEQMSQSLDDETALEAVVLFPEWEVGKTYEVDQRVKRSGILYRVQIAHTSQEDWTPEAAPSLFAKVLISEDGTVLAWEQPDSTNPYMKGDKVMHNGNTWVSLVDNNVWEPGAVGTETLWGQA